MTGFRDHPCFAREGVGVFTIGMACAHLSEVLKPFREAHEARVALGDPFSPERAAAALQILSALPAKTQSKILAASKIPADEGKRA